MDTYTVKRAEVGDMAVYLFADGYVAVTRRFDSDNPLGSFDEIGCLGAWPRASSNPDCPSIVRKALGLKYEPKDEEPEYMRVCDWFRRGQQQEALEGRR